MKNRLAELTNQPRFRLIRKRALLSIVLLWSVGCSKEDMNKLVDKVQTQVQEQTQNLTNEPVLKIAPSGTIKLNLNGEINCPAGNAALLVIGDDRPNVFQIKSYKTMDYEPFPSVLFQANTNATSIQSLVGQTVSGELNVALENGSVLWQSSPAKPVSITLQKIEETEIVGRISSGQVLSPDGKSASVSGEFRAVVMP